MYTRHKDFARATMDEAVDAGARRVTGRVAGLPVKTGRVAGAYGGGCRELCGIAPPDRPRP